MNSLNDKKQTYNPDVLNTLSNLSNDEVFTPPELAIKMLDLLPNSIWQDRNATFLDPSSKSGVFLREIAKRLLKGLKNEIPDIQERVNHIYNNQIYGIAITELTSLLSRRSLYCSKYATSKYSIVETDKVDGNIRYIKNRHTWSGQKCIYCGASKSEYDRIDELESHAYEFIHNRKIEEVFNVKFDVIIGNPPYQLSDGGAQASAKPIYNQFVDQAIKLNPRYLVMIIPSRWFTGGKFLDDFRKEMLSSNNIRIIHDFLNASECFPGVDIKGGVNYFLWDRDNPGKCKFHTHENGKVISVMERDLLEKNNDILIRYNESIEILRKVQSFNEQSYSSIVNSAMIFGFRTFFKEYDSTEYINGYIKVYGNRSIGYIKPDRLMKSKDLLMKWKIIIPEAIGSGDTKTDKINPIVSEPNSINTETYILNGPFKNEQETSNALTYINTKFFSFFLGLKKNTQHTSQSVYQLIPLQDFTEEWSDEKLYKKYNFSDSEIDYIEKMVRPNESVKVNG